MPILGRDEVTVKDIDEICTTHISSQIFAMVEAVAAKRQKQALSYYYDLLALKEPPMRILYLLVRQFKLLMEVKDLLRRGLISPRSQKRQSSIPLWPENICSSAGRFQRRSLRESWRRPQIRKNR